MAALAVVLLSGASGVAAADVALTGFATAGYAQASEDLRYLRYIGESGTLKADSLVGLQAEARFNPQWSATVQAVASAPRRRDEGYEVAIRWAFVSYRPDNEWLFRAGRVRPPVLINTQNAEVGVTYDQARLPAEVYSLSPVYDVDGAAVTRTWQLENAEVSVDAYWGKTDIKFRLPFQRDPSARSLPQLSGAIPPDNYFPEKITLSGVVVSHTTPSLLLRGGVHRATIHTELPVAETFAPTTFPAPPPFGGTLFVPSGAMTRIAVTVLTFGADWRVGDWRITGEYGRRILKDTKLGVDSQAGYVTVARSVGKWTPYVTHARLLSGSDTRKLYQEVNGTPVPLGAQGPPLSLPASFHRILADNIALFDQHSTMLGTSYSFSSTSKLKLEWMRTKVGLGSALVDGDVHNKAFNVFTLAYSAAF